MNVNLKLSFLEEFLDPLEPKVLLLVNVMPQNVCKILGEVLKKFYLLFFILCKLLDLFKRLGGSKVFEFI